MYLLIIIHIRIIYIINITRTIPIIYIIHTRHTYIQRGKGKFGVSFFVSSQEREQVLLAVEQVGDEKITYGSQMNKTLVAFHQEERLVHL